MAENEVAKFDMNDVKKRMVDQIRATFLMLMPDEAFNALIDAEVSAFFKTPESQHWQNNPRQLTPFQVLVRQEMETMFRDVLKKELAKPEWSNFVGYDEHNQPKLGAELLKMMQGMAPKLVEAMFQGTVYNVIEKIRQGH